MPFDTTQAQPAAASVRKALAAYRAVRFSTKTGVRAYNREKEARRADVLAAVLDARRASRVRRAFGRAAA